MSRRLLRMPDLKQKGLPKKTQIYELMAQGKFPKPIRVGERAVAWVEDEIDAWIDARIAQRDGQEAGYVSSRA